MIGFVELNKTYEFRSLTFYYIGTVEHVFPTHAKLKDVTQVFETGPNKDYYAGKIKAHERMPDGVLVPFNGTVVVPWDHAVSDAGLIA